MKARYRFLCDHSLNSALSAIEIYNKPDFKDREQIFTILMVTAWESLLKAKILKSNGNKITSLCVKDKGRYKRKRTGALWTIGKEEALRQCDVPELVRRNVLYLIDIRDAAVHLSASSSAISYIVFTLGTATLHNYSRLIRDWFGIGLSDYNFYILPLGFSYPFQTLSIVDLRKEPEDIAAIIREVTHMQADNCIEKDGFYLLCEIHTSLVSAKNITEETDLVASVEKTGSNIMLVRRDVNVLDQYPFTYTEVFKRIREELPNIKQHQFNKLIKDHQIKSNSKYSAFNYRSKREQTRGPSASTPIIYNYDFIRFAIQELSKE